MGYRLKDRRRIWGEPQAQGWHRDVPGCPGLRMASAPTLPFLQAHRATTMRLYSLSVLYKGDPKVHLLKAAYDVSTFNFFQRSRWVLVAGASWGDCSCVL